MPHLVLLGDSIFDNGAYTRGGSGLVSQVRKLLPREWNASLLAVDGATTDNISEQLERLPADATHLVLSVCGNDALMQEAVLDIPASTVGEAVGVLADVSLKFEKNYRANVDVCLSQGLPLAVCTVYNGYHPDRPYQRLLTTTLMVFNDVILRVAIQHSLAVVDLRAICVNPECA